MPIPAIVGALLPSLISALDIPKLVDMFKPGVPVAERNVKAATAIFEVAKVALGARSEQEVIERIAADPAAAATAKQAVEANWHLVDEAGAGGIASARQADVAFVATGEPVWKSPSFLVAMALMPLVYMIVLNVVGVLGKPLSDEVRSAIANGVVGLILGGLIGYYYGQTTSRNRAPPPN